MCNYSNVECVALSSDLNKERLPRKVHLDFEPWKFQGSLVIGIVNKSQYCLSLDHVLIYLVVPLSTVYSVQLTAIALFRENYQKT